MDKEPVINENLHNLTLARPNDEDASLELSADVFSRRYAIRGSRLMWLLGAGASAAAGIPTAHDMIWEFKQRLFASQRHVSVRLVADLANPATRLQLQAHIDGQGIYPPAGAPDEYAALFEATYPDEGDRQAYINAKIEGAKPSSGHVALATLMQARLANLIWTTNFDPLVADACARVFGTTGSLTSAGLQAPQQAEDAIRREQWPIEVKLHGDFRSRRLKNTSNELREQDSQLRKVFAEASRRFGLVVAGYSGRDASVMNTLRACVKIEGAFPGGLFWLHHANSQLNTDVRALIREARQSGVEAFIIIIDSFDEALRDLIRECPGVDTKVLDEFSASRRRWSAAPRSVGKRRWPVLRLNALPIVKYPTICRRVVCEIGGYAEVREVFQQANVDVLFARVRAGVLAFGSDDDVRRGLSGRSFSEFDLHTIDAKRLRYESGERGLLRSALTHAISRHCGLAAIHHRSADHLWPRQAEDPAWESLKKLVGPIIGTIKEAEELRWHEGIGVRMDWADDRLWLLFEPRTVFEGVTLENKAIASSFARERAVTRYNDKQNDLIDFWAGCLARGGQDLTALGIGAGIDATFSLSEDTAFSWRQ